MISIAPHVWTASPVPERAALPPYHCAGPGLETTQADPMQPP